MAYKNFNRLMLAKKVVGIVDEYYVPGATPYKWIWKVKVYPTYPMSYNSFLGIINTPNLDKKLEDEKKKVSPQMRFAF